MFQLKIERYSLREGREAFEGKGSEIDKVGEGGRAGR